MPPILLHKMQVEERIKSIVEAHFEGTDGFLVNIKKGNLKKIQVFVDRMNQNIHIDDCVAISRKLEQMLEEEAWVDEKYTLEVSSPGMGNPFRVLQQYQKNLNKNVEVLLLDGIKYEGMLKSVSEDGFVLEEHKKKKGAAPEIIMNKFKFEDIKNVKKKINF